MYSRTKIRTRQHVNPLASAFETFRGEVPELGGARPVEIEIGCAEAQFLFERAEKDPSRHYVGVEIREPWVHFVNSQARERKLPVSAVFAHANHHLRLLFARQSVACAYINFPDPWFKTRHKKRRLFDHSLVKDLEHVLQPGGDVLVQTDIWHLALAAMEAFERSDNFTNALEPWTFWKGPNPYSVRSTREMLCEVANRKVWRILYRRNDVCQRERPQ